MAAKRVPTRNQRIQRAKKGAYDPTAEKALNYARLTNLFTDAIRSDDRVAALGALKELNRLLGLYAARPTETPPAPEPLAAVVARYLVPLKLLPADEPASEHIRVAAQHLIDGTLPELQ